MHSVVKTSRTTIQKYNMYLRSLASLWIYILNVCQSHISKVSEYKNSNVNLCKPPDIPVLNMLEMRCVLVFNHI